MTDSPRVLGGRYEVGELIGRGGMAEVHLGHDTRLGRQVAIKMLRADLARDATFLARFRREAQSAAGLNHHAIVAVYDSGEDVFIETGGARVDVPYIVMEFVDGQTLREILNEEGRLAPDEAARITMGILAALEYSHDKGIVHRDIKPANVMVTRGGGVKVMDFGIARALADAGATMTSAQAVVGTARYLSPEQAQGATVDERSDLYSTGCVLFELLTGRTPFVGEPVSLVYQHIQDLPSAPSTYEPSVSGPMDAVTLHALEKERESRYQDAADFRADIQAARTGQPVSEAAEASAVAALAEPVDRRPAAVPPPSQRPDHTADIAHHEEPPRRTALWILAGIVALAAIFGIGWALFGGGDGDNGARQVEVPNVRNMQEPEATRVLSEKGFTVKAEPGANEAAKGTVYDQNPRQGASAPNGSAVTINVSTGPGELTMPNVLGKSVAAAKQTLTSNGFKASQIEVASGFQDNTRYAKDQVGSTTPAFGSSVSQTQKVTLRISSGKVNVPETLVGKSLADAAVDLDGAGLGHQETFRETTDESQLGKVIEVPTQGDLVDRGTKVELVIGTRATQTQTTQPPATNTPTKDPTSSSRPPTSSSSSSSSSSSTPPPSTSSTPSSPSSTTSASTPPPQASWPTFPWPPRPRNNG